MQNENQRAALKILNDVRAVVADSHIVYTSGKHGSAYVNKDALYPHVEETMLLCSMIAEQFACNSVEVVVAPALGGIVLIQWITYYLISLTSKTPMAVYAEKTADGNFAFTRGYDKFVAGKRVLVVEDILNTGGSAKKVIELVRVTGGEVVGLGALCNRGGITAEELGVPKLVSLVDIRLDAWDEDNCPLCAKNVPINTVVGKGREFLAQRMQE